MHVYAGLVQRGLHTEEHGRRRGRALVILDLHAVGHPSDVRGEDRHLPVQEKHHLFFFGHVQSTTGVKTKKREDREGAKGGGVR